MESILDSVKTMLGIELEDTDFDFDIITYINSTILELSQIGVGIQGEFLISNNTETWDDYLGENRAKLKMVESYIPLKVKSIFDPPQSGTMSEAMKNMLEEQLFRISVTVDSGCGGIE